MLSRKDYIELAELSAKGIYLDECSEIFISRLCSFLRADNPNFDSTKFYKHMKKTLTELSQYDETI